MFFHCSFCSDLLEFVIPMSITDAQRKQLEDVGYVVMPNLMTPGYLSQLQDAVADQYRAEGDQAGSEFKQEAGCKRLANLVNKGEVFRELIVHPIILSGVAAVLGTEFKLSSLNAREVKAHHDGVQPLHADMAAIADERGPWVCNTIWLMDDFTSENGAPRIVPGSHRFGQLPQEVLDDVSAPHPDEVLITGKAGTVVVMNAHAWHGGTGNRTAKTRTAIHAFYARSDKPQQQYQRQLLDQDLQSELSPQLRQLLALDDPENDRLSGADVVRSGFMK